MMMSTHAAVAVGLGQLNPDNSGECLDPDTGLSHGLGSPWSVSGCGEAKCDLRQGTVFISYSYCGNVYAEPGCYVQQDSFMPYPYCCPRSICPSNTFTDIISNSIDNILGNEQEEELQMQENNRNEVMVSSPDTSVNYDMDMENREQFDYYDWDSIFAQYGSSF